MKCRTFISTILATAITITGLTAVPARAGNDDLTKIIVGVAAVAIIGTAISNNKKKKRNDHYNVTRGDIYQDDVRRDPFYGADRRHRSTHRDNRDYDGVKRHKGHDHNSGLSRGHSNSAKSLPRRVQRKLLPASCRVQARGRNGRAFPAFGSNCLYRNFDYADRLPSQCATRARVRNGGKRHTVFSGRCLSEYGYSVARY